MTTITVLRGSPRRGGNTDSITDCFVSELRRIGCAVKEFRLYDMDLLPCQACRTCQKDWSIFGCPLNDDMHEIFDAVLKSDALVIATPVYSWYCTPPVKCVLDRLVYGMNKYYGDEKGPSLWEGKGLALITTCGYPIEKGTDLLEEGLRRYCKHSRLSYWGKLAERHLGYGTVFMDEEKKARAEAFARTLFAQLE